MNSALEIFSRSIEIFLAEKKWKQADLANATGISRQQLNKYVKGKTPPGLEIIEKIAKALGKPISDFFSAEVVISKLNASAVPSELAILWSQLDDIDRDIFLKQMRKLIENKAAKKDLASKG